MASAPRFHVPVPLRPGAEVQLPADAARHVQVLRLQPGDAVTLFGAGPAADAAEDGGEYTATITRMGRKDVDATVQAHHAVSREALRPVHLAIGMPANERMDWLVEKATELGACGLQPLMTERTVLRLDAARAQKKSTHWRSIAVAACEQCGRNRVPAIHDAQTLQQWLREIGAAAPGEIRCLLSFHADAVALPALVAEATAAQPFTVLAGPEGGLAPAEEALARAQGFRPVSLGPRVLRAETAVLAVLAALTLVA